MPRGAKKHTIPSVEWKLHIDGLVAAKIELFLTDPVRNKPRKGARSELTEQLYREWLDKRIAELHAAGKPLPAGLEEPTEPPDGVA